MDIWPKSRVLYVPFGVHAGPAAPCWVSLIAWSWPSALQTAPPLSTPEGGHWRSFVTTLALGPPEPVDGSGRLHVRAVPVSPFVTPLRPDALSPRKALPTPAGLLLEDLAHGDDAIGMTRLSR